MCAALTAAYDDVFTVRKWVCPGRLGAGSASRSVTMEAHKASRPISMARLQGFDPVYLPPIHVVVSDGPCSD